MYYVLCIMYYVLCIMYIFAFVHRYMDVYGCMCMYTYVHAYMLGSPQMDSMQATPRLMAVLILAGHSSIPKPETPNPRP